MRKTRVLRADGTILEKEPKSEAGKRVLAVPKHIVPILAQHVDRFVVDDPNAFLFTGVKGPATVHKHLLQFMEPGQNPH